MSFGVFDWLYSQCIWFTASFANILRILNNTQYDPSEYQILTSTSSYFQYAQWTHVSKVLFMNFLSTDLY